MIVVAFNGVRAIFVRAAQAPGPAGTSVQQPTPASRFPTSLAEAFSLQFGQVYLNFDQAHASQRAQQLAAFIPSGAGQQLGWNGAGRMQLASEQVAGITVQDADNALVTLLVTVNGQLMQFSVPIYVASGGMVVSGEPALLPPPAKVNPPSPPSGGGSDLTTQNEFENFLPSFLQAYAASDTATLGRYITKGFSIAGLGGVVSYNSIQNLTIPQGGSKRDITVTVRWQLPSQGGTAPATLDVTYEMTWIYQSGTWSVETITGSTQQAGQQAAQT
ncbi:MAG TPA: conjugal transfer protein [Streptosporangiaceae bacterium]|nr:conjugal transfer protein [Streptosporangiaceae bacterium]